MKQSKAIKMLEVINASLKTIQEQEPKLLIDKTMFMLGLGKIDPTEELNGLKEGITNAQEELSRIKSELKVKDSNKKIMDLINSIEEKLSRYKRETPMSLEEILKSADKNGLRKEGESIFGIKPTIIPLGELLAGMSQAGENIKDSIFNGQEPQSLEEILRTIKEKAVTAEDSIVNKASTTAGLGLNEILKAFEEFAKVPKEEEVTEAPGQTENPEPEMVSLAKEEAIKNTKREFDLQLDSSKANYEQRLKMLKQEFDQEQLLIREAKSEAILNIKLAKKVKIIIG